MVTWNRVWKFWLPMKIPFARATSPFKSTFGGRAGTGREDGHPSRGKIGCNECLSTSAEAENPLQLLKIELSEFCAPSIYLSSSLSKRQFVPGVLGCCQKSACCHLTCIHVGTSSIALSQHLMTLSACQDTVSQIVPWSAHSSSNNDLTGLSSCRLILVEGGGFFRVKSRDPGLTFAGLKY